MKTVSLSIFTFLFISMTSSAFACRNVLYLEGSEALKVIGGVMEYSDKFSSFRTPQNSSAENFKIKYQNLSQRDLKFTGEVVYVNREVSQATVEMCIKD